jgi:hypothetical protein
MLKVNILLIFLLITSSTQTVFAQHNKIQMHYSDAEKEQLRTKRAINLNLPTNSTWEEIVEEERMGEVLKRNLPKNTSWSEIYKYDSQKKLKFAKEICKADADLKSCKASDGIIYNF